MTGMVVEAAGLGNFGAPGGDQGSSDAAFVGHGFEAAEGGVAGAGPSGADGLVGVHGSGEDVGVVALPAVAALQDLRNAAAGVVGVHGFVGAAVVAQEEEECVVFLAHGADLSDDVADATVHAFDHGGVDFHAALFPGGVGGLGPGDEVGIACGEAPAAIEDAEGTHAFETAAAHVVPALAIAAALAGDFVFRALHGEVGGGEGGVEKEGVAGVVFAQIAKGAGGHSVGVVEAFGGGEAFVAVYQIAGHEVVAAGEGAEEAMEAALERPVVFGFGVAGGNVPLAGHVAAVAAGGEEFGDGGVIGAEIAAVGGLAAVVDHVADADLVGVHAGEQGGAGGAATGGVVEVGKAEAAAGEGVEVGGANFGAVAGEIAEAHVVGEDEDDVGGRGGLGGQGRGGGQQGEKIATQH